MSSIADLKLMVLTASGYVGSLNDMARQFWTDLAATAGTAGEILHVEWAGGDGGASSVGVNTRSFTGTLLNSITGASLSSATQITLPAGTYEVSGFGNAYKSDRTQAYLYDTTGSSVLIKGDTGYSAASTLTMVDSRLHGIITLTVESVLELRQHFQSAFATSGLGLDSFTVGVDSVHASLFFRKFA